MMPPTEQVGSIPRPAALIQGVQRALRIQRSNTCAAPRNTERRVVHEGIFENGGEE